MSIDHQFFKRHVEDDEEVVLIVHKHWLVGFSILFWPAFSFIVGWVALYMVPFRLMFYIVAVWSIGALVYLLRNFYDYYLDAWIITDQGIIDIEWHGWFHRRSTRVLYSDIQGVSYEIQGLFGTLLKFGEISVEKISTGSDISLDHVSHPRKVEGVILKNMEVYLHSKNLTDEEHVKDILAELVAREVQLDGIRDDDEDEDDEDEDDE